MIALAFTQIWQLTALVIIVFILTRLFGKSRPHLAYVLWLLVLIKAVTPPLWSSPSGVFSQMQARVLSEEVNGGVVTDSPNVAVDFDFVELSDGTFDTSEIVPYVYEIRDGEEAFATEDEREAYTVGGILIAVWATLTIAAIVFATFRYVCCLRRLKGSAVSEESGYHSLMMQLRKRLGVRRRVRLLITSSRVGPAVIGLMRPTIVLPELVLRGKRPTDLESILAHELIHIRRGDLWLGVLQVVAKSLWWFHPLVWWSARAASSESERCCDEQVIAELGCDPTRYARSLLEILEMKRTLRPIPTFPGMKPVEITSQRMERIMKLGQGCHKRTPWWCWVVMLIASAAVLPGATLVVGDEEADFLVAPQPIDFRAPPPLVSTVPDGGTVLLGSIRTYKVADVIARIQKDTSCDEATAMLRLGNMIRQPQRPPVGLVAGNDSIRLSHEALVIAESAAGHQRVASILERIRRFGMTQIAVELWFVTASPKVIDSAITKWELAPMPISAEEATGPSAFLHRDIDRPLPNDDAQPETKAGVVTESRLPAIYRVLDDEQAKELLETVKGDRRTNVLFAPRVTLFNGQSATIADSSLRPFVVGIQAHQPQIRVITEGTTVRLRPLLRDDRLWFDYEVNLSRIKEVHTKTLNVANYDEPLTLQVPKVQTTRVESSAEFALGKTLVIGGLQTEGPKGKPQAMLVMMRASRLAPGQARPREDSGEEAGVGPYSATPDKPRELQVRIDDEGKPKGRQTWRDIVRNRNDRLVAADAWRHETVPVLGPITAGGPPTAIDPPSDDQVLRAIKRADELKGVEAALAAFDTQLSHENIRITKEKIAEFVDPPRFVPNVGPAQLHHTHYKCTVRYTESKSTTFPVPHKTKSDVEHVVYIDQNHFHMVGDNKADHFADVQTRLRKSVTVDFHDVPLAEFVREMAKQTGIRFTFDKDRLAKEGVAIEQPIQLVLSTPISARSCLSLILQQFELGYFIQDGIVVVTSSEAADARAKYDQLYQSRVTFDFNDATLKEALESFARSAEVNICISPSIRVEGVSTTTIVTASGKDVTLAVALDRVLKPLRLVYRLRNEVIEIVTEQALASETFTKVYNVADIVIALAAKTTPERIQSQFDVLMEAIEQNVAPATWSDQGGAGAIEAFPTNLSLVVSQTHKVHHQIAIHLNKVRESMGLDVAKQPPISWDQVRAIPEQQVISKVYAVAELVIPPPSIFRESASDPDNSLAMAAKPDFETLINLITSTVSPTTWEEVGGSGRIRSMPTNLSLVVKQTRKVHEEIGDLLYQMRKLQDVQVTLETRLIGLPDSFFEKVGIDYSFEIEDLPQPEEDLFAKQGSAKLTDIETFFLLQAAQSEKSAAVMQAPKVTLFNGQAAGINFGGAEAKIGRMVQFQPVVSDDRKSVRLTLAVGEKELLGDAEHAQHFKLADGQTVLVDVSEKFTPWKRSASPKLPNIPYVQRLFKDSPPPEKITRTLLLLTPKIVVVEEEEEKVGISIPND
jgi:beta-lactamase regulating signal transducer with metallopeptidase domain